MSGGTSVSKLPEELQREHLRPEPRSLAEVVVSRGGGGGVGLLEAFLHCYFKPKLVEAATHFYTRIVPVAESVDEKTALIVCGKLVRLMEETAGEPLSAVFHIPLSAGMFTVTGIAAGQSKPTNLTADTALRGRPSVWAGTISDHRTGHKTHYSDVKLVPTEKAIGLFPRFNEAATFIDAIERLGVSIRGDGNERIITVTKAQLHASLQKEYPGQFHTLKTFSRYYASGGQMIDQLGFPLKWMEDRNNKNR